MAKQQQVIHHGFEGMSSESLDHRGLSWRWLTLHQPQQGHKPYGGTDALNKGLNQGTGSRFVWKRLLNALNVDVVLEPHCPHSSSVSNGNITILCLVSNDPYQHILLYLKSGMVKSCGGVSKIKTWTASTPPLNLLPHSLLTNQWLKHTHYREKD